MTAAAANTVIPWLRYRNAFVAIDWLRHAFGFEPQLIQAEGHVVHHARLVCGNGMVILGSADDGTEWDRHLLQPDETGGRETQSCWVVVDDVDAHHAQAVQAGAEVVIPLADVPGGGRGYACRDIEGHLWWFGEQHPLAAYPVQMTRTRAPRQYHH
ncbi:MAG TPA: VOC family protein [Lysobacter sp.]